MEVEGRFTIHDVCSPCSLAIQQQVQNEDLCIDVEGYMWYDLALHDHNQNDAVGRQSASVQLLYHTTSRDDFRRQSTYKEDRGKSTKTCRQVEQHSLFVT